MNPCCEKSENLGEPQQIQPGLMMKVCQVCGNRHFELTLDPAVIGVEIKSL